jgi:hypothetical protein
LPGLDSVAGVIAGLIGLSWDKQSVEMAEFD